MSNSFTETTSVSWFGRLRNSVGGVIIGLLLIIGMVVLLFWNEGRAVTTARSLAEGAGAVVSVGADAVDATNEGKLIHVSGTVTTNSVPSDDDFAISAPGVRLVRNVEMYQWKEESHSETTKKLGGGEETITTYTYSKEWDDEPDRFRRLQAAFRAPESGNGRAQPFLPDTRGQARRVQSRQAGAGWHRRRPADGDKPDKAAAIDAGYAGTKKVSIVDGRIYLGWNPSSPAIGDYRISYEVAPLGVISVIGQQHGSQFQAYQTIAGDRLLMVDVGNVPAAQMFKEAADANRLITWVIRGVGLLLLAIGFGLFMSPLAVIARLHPAIGQRRQVGNRDHRLLHGGRGGHHHHRHRVVLLSPAACHRHSCRRRGDRRSHRLHRTCAAASSGPSTDGASHTGLTGLLNGQERLDLACRALQQRQDLAAHGRNGEAARLRRDVDRRNDPAGAVVDRHGDRAQADLQFLVDCGKALRGSLHDQGVKLAPVCDCLLRTPADRCAIAGISQVPPRQDRTSRTRPIEVQ